MKKNLLLAVLGLSILSGVAYSFVADRRDLHNAKVHLHQVVVEMSRAGWANDGDMNGHAGKAIRLAKQAEAEVDMAIAAAQQNTH